MIERSTAILAAVILIAAGAICVAHVMTANDNTEDTTPQWAKDTAAKLTENGGTIYLYSTTSNGTYTALSFPATKVTADSHGLYVDRGRHVYFCPYDRIAEIYK